MMKTRRKKWRLKTVELQVIFRHDTDSMMLICEHISAKYDDKNQIWIAHTSTVNIGDK